MKANNPYSLIRTIFCFFAIAMLHSSCTTPNKINDSPVYFREGGDTVNANQKERFIQPFDILSIQIYSKTPNQEQAAVFNILNTASSMSSASAASGSSGGSMQGYRVNEQGDIEVPVIGNVNTSGLTIYKLQDYLSQKVANYVKSPAVIVHYMQFDISVLGEVHVPGIKKFTTDRVTILDAISASGDLTDYGKRNDIVVIRESGGKQIFYKVDIRNRDIFKSPVYLLQPHDIVYVNPNKQKLETLNVSPNAQRNTTLIFALIGISLSVATLIISLQH